MLKHPAWFGLSLSCVLQGSPHLLSFTHLTFWSHISSGSLHLPLFGMDVLAPDVTWISPSPPQVFHAMSPSLWSPPWLWCLIVQTHALNPLFHFTYSFFTGKFIAYLGGSVSKNLFVMQETQVWSLSWNDPLEEEMATHSSILAWGIPRAEEPDRLQSIES